jgi:hypothetical protein
VKRLAQIGLAGESACPTPRTRWHSKLRSSMYY